MIQALPTDGSDQPFHVRSLPGRPRRREDLFDSHRLHLRCELVPKDPVSVPQQIMRRSVPRKCLTKLLGCPLRGWMRCYADMDNAAPIVCQHQKYVQDLEADCRYHKEIHRDQGLHTVSYTHLRAHETPE